jgi:hypothetical protein
MSYGFLLCPSICGFTLRHFYFFLNISPIRWPLSAPLRPRRLRADLIAAWLLLDDLVHLRPIDVLYKLQI